MKNGDKPACPVVIEKFADNGEHSHYEVMDKNTGVTLWSPDKGNILSKREKFALYAPPIPEWFKYESKLTAPKVPYSWTSMNDGDDKKECMNWQRDPCFDLPDHLQWYQKAWEMYGIEYNLYADAKQSEYYFAWRLYFADELLKKLES